MSSQHHRLVAMECEVKFKVIAAIHLGVSKTTLGFSEITDDDYKERIHVYQDWWTEISTDILLAHDGKFIAFGDDALKRFSDNLCFKKVRKTCSSHNTQVSL